MVGEVAFLWPRQRAITGQHSSTPPMVTWCGLGFGLRLGLGSGLGYLTLTLTLTLTLITPASCAVPSSTVGTMK